MTPHISPFVENQSSSFSGPAAARAEKPPSLSSFIKDGVLDLPEEWRDFPNPLSIKGLRGLVSLGNLRTIKGGLYIWDCLDLKDFGDLTTVVGPIDCQNCPSLEDVSHLQQARGFVDLEDSRVSSLPDRFTLLPLLPRLKPFALLAPSAP